MKKITLLTIFAFCFIAFGYSQADCGSALVLTPGTPQAGATTTGVGSFSDSNTPPNVNPCSTNYNDLEYWFQYTAVTTGETLDITVTDLTTNYYGVFVIDNCPDSAPTCVAQDTNGFSSADLTLTTPALTAGITYYIVMTDWIEGPTTFTMNAVVNAAPTCLTPNNLNVNVLPGDVSATVSWDSEAGATLGYNWAVMAVGEDPEVDTPVSLGSTAVGVTSATATGLTAGNSYDFYVQSNCDSDGLSPWAGPFNFLSSAPATNDECSGAINLDSYANADGSCTMTFTGSNIGATFSAAEGAPSGTCVDADATPADVWFTFTVPASGAFDFEFITNPGFSTVVELYTGSCGSLTPYSPVNCGNTASRSFTGLTPSDTVFLRVWDYSSDEEGTLEICVNYLTCTSATTNSVTNVPDCGTSQYSLDVDVATIGDGTVISDGLGGSFPIVAGIVTAGPYAFGTSVTLTVEHSDVSCNYELGTYVISVCPPANDECAGAIGLTVNSDYNCGVVTAGTTVGATASSQTDDVSGTPNTDVWFSFVATTTAHRISLLNRVTQPGGTSTSTDMGIGVYDGTGGCAGLVYFNTSDPETMNLSGLTVGVEYFVRVYGWGTTIQFINFDICVGTPPPPPANDECGAAIGLTVNADYSCGTVTSGTVAGATDSGVTGSTCGGTDDDDVWYSFEATNTAHRVSLINVAGSTTDMYHAVYDATPGCGTLGAALICSDGNTSNLTGLTIGNTYYVQVYTYTSTVGQTSTFDICVGTAPTCYVPTGLSASFVPTDSANVSWVAPTSGTVPASYNWEVVPSGNGQGVGVVSSGNVAGLTDTATGLTADTLYDLYVQSNCGGGDLSAWAGPFSFNAGYCIPSGTSASTYINNFSTTDGETNISNLNSGFSTGNYGNNYSTMSVSAPSNGTFNFNVEIVSGTVGCAIWIDWNNDYVFDVSEVSFTTTGYGNGPFTGSITIPNATVDGDYRMRVLIDYNDSNPGDDAACSFGSGRGEAEDYKVIVNNTISTNEYNLLEGFTYYPNPVNDNLSLKAQKEIQNVAVYNMLGQEVLRTAPNAVNSDVNMSNLQAGTYFVKVTVENATKTIKVIKK